MNIMIYLITLRLLKTTVNSKILAIVILLISGFYAHAQWSRTDSLKQELLVTVDIDRQMGILKELYKEILFNDPESALRVARESDRLRRNARPDDATAKMDACNQIGTAYMYLNKSDSALHYYQMMVETAFMSHDSVQLSKAYNNIGALSGNTGNIDAAIFYINKSAEIDELSGNIQGAVISYVNIGAIYTQMQIPDSARYFLSKGIRMATQNSDNALLATCYMNLGVAEYYAGNYAEAKKTLFDAIGYAQKVREMDIVSKSYRNLAKVFQQEGKYKIAIEYDMRSLETATSASFLENAMDAHLGLAVSNEKLGDFREALNHYKSYKILDDSLDVLYNDAIYIEMQEKYKSKQAFAENQILVQKNEIQHLELSRNEKDLQNSRIIIISSIVGLVLLLVLAFTLYNRSVIRQRANLKLQEANAIIQEKNNDIMASIEYASKIQEALLPGRESSNLFRESFFLLRPKDVVSGDFLWYTAVGHLKIFAVVDCTGHGVPGAFMSMIGNTFLHQIVNEKGVTRPDEVLNELRHRIVHALNQKGDGENRKDGMDMSLCVLDEKEGKLQFAGANNPLFLVKNQTIQEIKGDKQPVGFFEGRESPFTLHELQVREGDCIYLCSDGYADQFGGPKGKKFKYKQLKELFAENSKLPMQKQKDLLNQRFDSWRGALEQVDDVCVIGVRV